MDEQNENNVLIVDDSAIDRKIMRKVITRKLEYVSIYESSDGLNLINIMGENHIKVVILDIMLPGISGLELLKNIRSNIQFANIPVIICSAIAEDDLIYETLELGAYDYFEKPLSDRAVKFSLALKVKNALDLRNRTEKIKFMRDHDMMTGLRTRRYFEYHIDKYNLNRTHPLTVIMFDINGLKIINDAYGRKVGDRMLQYLADKLTVTFKDSKMISRWGGDEFIALLENSTKSQVQKQAENLKNDFIKSFKPQYNISLSYGYVIKKDNKLPLSHYVKLAEDQLSSNKILEENSSKRLMIDSMTHALHVKNPREEKHSQRVSELGGLIATELGLSDYEVKKVILAGLLHDIGKISIDESILNKEGKLSHDEWLEIKKHPETGYRILSGSADTIALSEAALSHHERWDGKGYPNGLKKEEIPLISRIITVADSYDAMTGPRTYRKVFTSDEAIDELLTHSGTQFDPIIVEAFIKTIKHAVLLSN